MRARFLTAIEHRPRINSTGKTFIRCKSILRDYFDWHPQVRMFGIGICPESMPYRPEPTRQYTMRRPPSRGRVAGAEFAMPSHDGELLIVPSISGSAGGWAFNAFPGIFCNVPRRIPGARLGQRQFKLRKSKSKAIASCTHNARSTSQFPLKRQQQIQTRRFQGACPGKRLLNKGRRVVP